MYIRNRVDRIGFMNTVEPLNKGHLGTQAAVPYSEVVRFVVKLSFSASNDV